MSDGFLTGDDRKQLKNQPAGKNGKDDEKQNQEEGIEPVQEVHVKIPCPACSTKRKKVICLVYRTVMPFQYVKCPKCGFTTKVQKLVGPYQPRTQMDLRSREYQQSVGPPRKS